MGVGMIAHLKTILGHLGLVDASAIGRTRHTKPIAVVYKQQPSVRHRESATKTHRVSFIIKMGRKQIPIATTNRTSSSTASSNRSCLPKTRPLYRCRGQTRTRNQACCCPRVRGISRLQTGHPSPCCSCQHWRLTLQKGLQQWPQR